jgi:hypothetical protein
MGLTQFRCRSFLHLSEAIQYATWDGKRTRPFNCLRKLQDARERVTDEASPIAKRAKVLLILASSLRDYYVVGEIKYIDSTTMGGKNDIPGAGEGMTALDQSKLTKALRLGLRAALSACEHPNDLHQRPAKRGCGACRAVVSITVL